MPAELPALIITQALTGLIGLAVDGLRHNSKIQKEAKEKLKRVYREIALNKTLLEKSGCLACKGISVEDKTFISLAKELRNDETAPLYKYNKRRLIFPDTEKEVKRRRVQYALNYVITQIDALKAFAKLKRKDGAPGIRLGVRLRTLHKHFSTLEKILRLQT